MVELSAIRTRAIDRRDERTIIRLINSGKHYVEFRQHPYENSIVAEIPTLTPAIVGYVGWFDIATKSRIMPKLYVACAAVDPYLVGNDGDAIIVSLLRAMYGGFADVKRGYLKTRLDTSETTSRSLLEAEGWGPFGKPDTDGWLNYAWFAEKYFTEPQD